MEQERIRYQRDFRETYLVIEGVQASDLEGYEAKMVLQNQISGLAACETERLDGKIQIRYQVTSLQNLEQLYAVQKISEKQMVDMLKQTVWTLQELEKYLLDGLHLCVSPDLFFWDLEREKAVFLYDFRESREKDFQTLAKFWLERVDYEDERAVELSYYFYDEVEKENFSAAEILQHIEEKKAAEGTVISERQSGELSCSESLCEEPLCKETPCEKLPHAEPASSKPSCRVEEAKRLSVKSEAQLGSALLLTAAAGMVVFKLVESFFLLETMERQMAFLVCGILLFLGLLLTGKAVYSYGRSWSSSGRQESGRPDKSRGEKKEEERDNEKDSKKKNQENDEKTQEADGKTIYLGKEVKKRQRFLMSAKRGKEMEYEIREFPFVIGKDRAKVHCMIKEGSVSRIHARFLEVEGDIYLEDLHSTNGTYVNDLLLEPHVAVRVKSGDTICFGKTEFVYY